MASARYWRVIGLSAHAGRDVELSAFHLYNAAGERVDGAALLSSGVPPIAGSIANLQDASTATSALLDPSSPGFYLLWDFGAGSTASITAVRLGAADEQARFVSEITLQYSVDGLDWVWLSTTGQHPWPGARTMGSITQVVSGDESFDKVSLLLQVDGANGTLDFKDKSVPEKSFSVSGTPRASSEVTFAGLNSIKFDSSGGYLNFPRYPELDLGSQDFTIEAWVQVSNYRNAVFMSNTGMAVTGFVFMFTDYGFLRFICYTNGGAYLIATSNTYYGLYAKTHVAVSRANGRLMLFMNGTKCADVAISQPLPAQAGDFRIGSFESFEPYRMVNGYIGEIRITRGLARYTDSFAPSENPLPGGGGSANFGAIALKTAGMQLSAFVQDPSAGGVVQILQSANAEVFKDLEFGGAGRIFGTTETKGTPSNVPAKSRVLLLHQRSRLLVRETWSDPVTGEFSFEGLDVQQEFLALAEDAGGNFAAVAAQRLVPEVAT